VTCTALTDEINWKFFVFIVLGISFLSLTVHKFSTWIHYCVLFWPQYSESRSYFAHQACSTICVLYLSRNQFQCTFNGVSIFYRFRDIHID